MQVGLVVPTLNSAATLDWTLLSLTRQWDCAVRIVVADSHSTDSTLAICERWAVPVLQVPAGNMYRAINAGLRSLETEWVGYVNSDDVLYLDGLRRLAVAARDAGADVVYGHSDFFDASGRFLHALDPARPADIGALLRRGILPFAQPAALFRRELSVRLGGFREDLKYASDYDFFARAALLGCRFVRVGPPSVAAFRLHEAQLSVVGGAAVQAEIAGIRSTLPKAFPAGDAVTDLRWRASNLKQTFIAMARSGTLRRRVPSRS